MTLKKTFDLQQTNIAKGIACLLLLFHHLFSNPDKFSAILYFRGAPLACEIATFSKVCVSIFLILSGYGISISMKKSRIQYGNSFRNNIIFSLRHLWKLWANYAVIFLLFVPWQSLFDHFPYNSWWEIVIDFCGLSYLFRTTTINATWWYMTVAIVAYLLTPLFELVISKHKFASIALVLVLYTFFIYLGYVFWIVFYYIGYIIGKTSLFEKLSDYQQKNKVSTFISISLILMSSLLIRHIYPISSDIFLASSIIIISFLFISRIKIISAFLKLFGEHSGNVFMFHTFIYVHDFSNLVYASKYVPFIFITLVVICLLISIVIELIKKYTLVNRFISLISLKILSHAH